MANPPESDTQLDRDPNDLTPASTADSTSEKLDAAPPEAPSSPQPRIEEQVSAPPAPADATAPIEEPSIPDESRSEENSVSASETAPVTEAASETASEAPASEVEPASASDAPASETAGSDEPEADPLPTFEELGLPTRLISAVRAMGWKMPTRVQVECQPPMTAGKDVLVQSHTGSGKTGAFCIPWLTARFDQRPASETGVQLLVILPTRELAKQVCDELVRLASETPVDVLPVYGGTAMRPQLSALERGVHAVVGTPGRVLDHIRRRSLKLGNVNTVVLDECDEMLSMGFLEDIRAILDACSGPHQTCLFSATIPRDIQRIAKRYMSDPVNVELSGDHVAAAEIDHGYYMVNSAVKTRDLLDILMLENPTRAIIFCNTREETKLVSSVLNREGYDAHPLSSDLTQSQREKVMGRMREHKLRFLVATDVAARGIDISHVTHVINYSFPESAEVYVHRTGRTGRAGRTGTALSLISPRELGNFYTLKLHYSTITFAERKTPPAAQLAAERTEYRLDQISQLLPEMVGPEWVALARSLMADPRGERVISFLLSRAVRSQEKARRQALALEEDPQEHPREHEYEADSEDGDGRRNRRPRRGRERDRGRERGDRSRSRDRSDRRDRDSDRNSRDDRRSRDASPETSKTDEGRKRRRRRSGREDKNVQADAEVKVAAAEDSATEAAEVPAPTEVAQTAPENATSAAGETPTEATAAGESSPTESAAPAEKSDETQAAGETQADETKADEAQAVDATDEGDGQPKKRRRRRRRRRRKPGAEGAEGAEGESSVDAQAATPSEDEPGSEDAAPPKAAEEQAGSKRQRRRRRRGRGKVQAAPDRPRVTQDEILIDIDESELEVVRGQFGEIDELDELTLKGRRRAVIDTLQDEVEIEDLSQSDAQAKKSQSANEPEDSDDSEDSDDDGDADNGDEDSENDAETDGDEGTAAKDADSSDAEADEPRKKRRRRRRRRRSAPPPPPDLTAPPHKDFWVVWSDKYTFSDFEDEEFLARHPEIAAQIAAQEAEAAARAEARAKAAESKANRRRRDKPDAEPTNLVKIRLNLGRRHGHKAADIRSLLRQRLELEGRAIRDLTVREASTLLRVDESEVERIQSTLNNVEVAGVTLTVTQPDADTSPALRIDTPADVMAEAASMAQALVLAQDSRDEADADNEQAKATNGASADEATKPADAANDAAPAEEAPAEVAADFIVPEVVETATPDTEAPSPAG